MNRKITLNSDFKQNTEPLCLSNKNNMTWVGSMFFQLMVFGMIVSGLLLTPNSFSAQSASEPPFDPWAGTYQVRQEVPFVWVRLQPNINSPILETLPSQGILRTHPLNLSQPEANTAWDATHNQWWGMVRTSHTSGWVEMQSLNRIGDIEDSYVPLDINGQQPESWQSGHVVRVRANVPSTVLRDSPYSSETTNAGEVLSGALLVILESVRAGDTQFMWPVRDPNSLRVGFVEQSSLEFVRTTPDFSIQPIPASSWRSGFKIRVKSDVPFVWLRDACHSNAGIRYTILSKQSVWIPGGEFVFDGVQDWATVTIPGRSPITGCIEVNSFEFSGLYP